MSVLISQLSSNPDPARVFGETHTKRRPAVKQAVLERKLKSTHYKKNLWVKFLWFPNLRIYISILGFKNKYKKGI